MDAETAAADGLASQAPQAQPFSTGQGHSPGYVWYVVFLLSVVNAFNYMDRMALSALAPLIKADLKLSDSQLGLLTGFSFFLFYAICELRITQWADRSIRRNIISVALAIWSSMTVLSGAVRNFWPLFAARIGLGAGEAGCTPPSQSLICDYVPMKRRPGIFAIHDVGLWIGLMVGMALAGWLGETVGWRWTFVALGLPGLAMAAIVRLTLRAPTQGFFDAVKNDQSRLSFRGTIGVLMLCRAYRWLLFGVLNGFVQSGLNQWWPSLYVRVLGLSLSVVGVCLGVAIGVGSVIGTPLGGLLANKTSQRDVRLPLIIGAVATSLALPAALGSLFIPSALGSVLLVSFTALFWSVGSGPVRGNRA